MHLTKPSEVAGSAEPPAFDAIQSINLRLALLGLPGVNTAGASDRVLELTKPLLSRNFEMSRLLVDYLPPVDRRIHEWLEEYLYDTGIPRPRLERTLALDVPGLARVLSLPPDQDEYSSGIVHSYRVRNGILNNPAADRRTTKGIFHVAEGGLPIPADKLTVPKVVFARMLTAALRPPSELLRLPFTATQPQPAECWVSLLLRPLVCPAVPGFCEERRMEIRFFAPGSLVSNLDFVESIFGNGGDPLLPENDAALDPVHWTGHTGCVVLAPHLTQTKKKELGLPHWEEATERQRRDGMCWKEEDELYNNGSAFKVTARDEHGVIVTLIADNYYGYCKKEVKTHISYSANLFGLCEEEHAGGALVYASYDLGEEFSGDNHVRWTGHSFEELQRMYGDAIELHPEGWATDRQYPEITYVPEDAHFDLRNLTVSWAAPEGTRAAIKLLADRIYVRPSGYQVRMEKPPGKRAWRLVGTVSEPVFCHKPCTVSGGGKSEISKPISDAIIQGPVFVADLAKDLQRVDELLTRDYSKRFRDPAKAGMDQRSVLDSKRSLGSVIQLFTVQVQYADEYNEWVRSIPQYIKEMVFVVKRFHKPSWGAAWREHFSTDVIDGKPGNELRCDGRKLVSNYLRVGYAADGSWRIFGLRKDFHPAFKIQTEDDISASVVVPRRALSGLASEFDGASAVKFVKNCETRLFQRPDECVHRGYDLQAEADIAGQGTFLSNFEPLSMNDARLLVEDAVGFTSFTPPMQQLILDAAAGGEGPAFFVSSAHPRMVDGKPSKNPRYLQLRPDLKAPRDGYLAEMSTRLQRRLPLDAPVPLPVNAVISGRRNNPPEEGVRPLCAYNPLHFMEVPELMMEWMCSITGKSPSTTGAGSEGALTKGPFNAVPGILDMNAAFLAHVLTECDGFISSAGYVGPKVRVDHDISLLIPEIWARMSAVERRASYLIENGYLERCEDRTMGGRPVLASRLGWRITQAFVQHFLGRVFHHPNAVFPIEMLKPELQDEQVFAEAVQNIVEAQQHIAAAYFEDGSVALAIPPLRALLHVMRDGQWEGKTLEDREFRTMFTRESVIASAWYKERLEARQSGATQAARERAEYLDKFLAKPNYAQEAERLNIRARGEAAWDGYHAMKKPEALEELHDTIGVQPLTKR